MHPEGKFNASRYLMCPSVSAGIYVKSMMFQLKEHISILFFNLIRYHIQVIITYKIRSISIIKFIRKPWHVKCGV